MNDHCRRRADSDRMIPRRYWSPTSVQGRIESRRIPQGETSWIVSKQKSKALKASGFQQSKSNYSMMVPMTAGTGAQSRFCWRWTEYIKAQHAWVWQKWTCSGWK